MLIGVRKIARGDKGDEVVYEYRLDSFGNAVQTAGRPRRKQDLCLGPWCNMAGPSIAMRHGMEWKPIPLGEERVLTPANGREFLLGMLVEYARMSTYGWVEAIEDGGR